MIRILIRTESDGESSWWVSQCLEYDIAAQAETLRDLEREFQRVVVGQIIASMKLGMEPFGSLKRAPARYWKAWDEASRAAVAHSP